MTEINNANVSLEYNLNNYDDPNEVDDLYHVVVQKGNVGSSYVYVLQLLHKGTNIYVFRGNRQKDVAFDKNNPVLRLIGQDGNTAGGHTQTWEYAGQSGDWLVGTKPDPTSEKHWTTQITRVHIPDGTKIYKNTELPRLSHLNYAGGYHIDMLRVEAAVSPGPDYDKLLIASVDNSNNGYFSVYSMAEVNEKLTRSQYNVSNGIIPDVDIRTLDCKKSFMISGLGDSSRVGSIQGYDIDENANNIYISSQKAKDDPKDADTERKIVKIPWGETNTANWEKVNLTTNGVLDVAGYYTELEGIQYISDRSLYLTVSYHRRSDGLTAMNKIFKVSWN